MRIPIYSRDMTRIGTIRHASKVGYKRMFNDLHTASFEIPADDDADNDLCETVHGIVDIVDGDKSVGKYRICDQPESDITGEGEFIQYELEHVIAFLFDDRIGNGRHWRLYRGYHPAFAQFADGEALAAWAM